MKNSSVFSTCRDVLSALSVVGLVGLYSTPVLADCPSINSPSQAQATIDTGNETLYFCQQFISSDNFHYEPNAEDVITGGSQVLRSPTEAVGNAPIGSGSVDLTGPSFNVLNLNTLSSDMPVIYSNYSKRAIFNFYTQLKYTEGWNCYGTIISRPPNQYNLIVNYLRSNANIFQANNGAIVGQPLTSGDNIAILKDVPLQHANGQTSNAWLTDITFYHSNNRNSPKQWYTNKDSLPWTRFCWVGISARIKVKPNPLFNPNNVSGLANSGTHLVNVSVNW